MAASLTAIVDSGPLYAAADLDDDDHDAALGVLARSSLHIVIPTLVVAEVTYFIGTRLGPHPEGLFLEGLADLDAPSPGDWKRIAELVEQYADVPLGGTDASVIALAERVGAATIITLDRRHFGAVRPRHVNAFSLLP